VTETEQATLLQPDVSDMDRWVGIPLGMAQPKEPFSVNDIRRYVQGMDNVNPLYYDENFAAASVFGQIVAPQSYFGGGAGTGAKPSIQGTIPGSHMLFGGDEQWFYGPRVFPGDRLRLDGMLFDYRLTSTKFAGPTVISRGDTTYVNQSGEFLAKQRSTSIRYLVQNVRALRNQVEDSREPAWSAEDLRAVEQRKRDYFAAIVTHAKRLYGDTAVGEELFPRVIGPHSIHSFVSESRTNAGGTNHGPWSPYVYSDLPRTEEPGWIPEMSKDETPGLVYPGAAEAMDFGASRGHVQPEYARLIGMPRGYGYGASMCAWTVDFLSNWAGEWGFVQHHKTQYLAPALTGNITVVTGTVADKYLDPKGRGVVQVRYEMTTQDREVIAKGVAEVRLPCD
jgi:acyl dehydratase